MFIIFTLHRIFPGSSGSHIQINQKHSTQNLPHQCPFLRPYLLEAFSFRAVCFANWVQSSWRRNKNSCKKHVAQIIRGTSGFALVVGFSHVCRTLAVCIAQIVLVFFWVLGCIVSSRCTLGLVFHSYECFCCLSDQALNVMIYTTRKCWRYKSFDAYCE